MLVVFPPVSPRDTKDQKVLVFTCAMDCYANVDGVTWFSREIFPSVKETFPDALFYIVGSNPAPTPWCRQINYKNFTIMENLPDDFRLVLLPDDDAELREYNIKLLTQYIYDDVPVVFVRMHLSSGKHLHYYQNYNVYAPLATA